MNDIIRHDPYPVGQAYRGIYAHGVETSQATKQLLISGQVGVSPDGALAQGFVGQARQALSNLESVLRAADMQLSDIVKMCFFLVRREDMDDLVAVRKERLEGVRPAITTVYVAGLVSEDWLVEVEAVAAKRAPKEGSRMLAPF